jgi:S-(hydroxymethyl)glutathione dehydrogenase/alcohol dehydrogenase
MHEKRLIGSVYGSGNPLEDIEDIVRLSRAGRVKLDELSTRTYRLEQINQAFRDLAAGAGGRGVVVF